jgi:ribosomal-protein-alanine N-acetyltransferase
MFPWGLPFGRSTLREAELTDRDALIALVHRERRLHVHLDWMPVEDWLGQKPFWVAERGGRLVGALACPPSPPNTAWLRLFAADNANAVWKSLWPPALEQLRSLPVSMMAALSVDEWLGALLRDSGFEQTHAVVALEWRGNSQHFASRPLPNVRVRLATAADDAAIIHTDTTAFEAPWQLSAPMLLRAMRQANYLTVAEAEGQVVGYQLTTAGYDNAHLGRLAVLPEWRGRGLGAAITRDLLRHYHQRHIRHITVNTQDTNRSSLNVYHRLGFVLTGEKFPVYQLTP